MVYLGTAKNCSSGHAISGEPQANQENKGEKGIFFYGGDGGVRRGCYKQIIHWRKLGIQSVVASHWVSCDRFSLAGLLPGEEKFFLPLAG